MSAIGKLQQEYQAVQIRRAEARFRAPFGRRIVSRDQMTLELDRAKE
jgi:hypothetical protein